MKLILSIILMMICGVCAAQDYQSWLERCDQYRAQVQSILESNGVSSDYYYLMVAESRCTGGARSSRGALGFWQLMKSTSMHYGCKDPQNLECATNAAAKYIKGLESRFDSFDDVIIAYNMGGTNYKRRQKPTGEALWLAKKVRILMDLSVEDQ